MALPLAVSLVPDPLAAQVIGVDVGGTGLKLARFRATGECLAEYSLATPRPAAPGAVATAIVEAIEQLDPQRLAPWVGVGLPGPTDRAGRVARIAINLPGWDNVPLADWLESRLGRRVTLGNDGNCAVLGEQWQGAAQGLNDVVLLTLVTGVGGGVILGGNLFTGRQGAAAEPGLIGLDPDGPQCNSGNNGSLESFCSIGAVARASGFDPAELSARAAAADPEALAAWATYGRLLGCGISTLVYAFTPERVLLGGGLSAAFPYFSAALEAEVERRVLFPSREGLVISQAALGNGAGRVGAARLALDRFAGGGPSAGGAQG